MSQRQPYSGGFNGALQHAPKVEAEGWVGAPAPNNVETRFMDKRMEQDGGMDSRLVYHENGDGMTLDPRYDLQADVGWNRPKHLEPQSSTTLTSVNMSREANLEVPPVQNRSMVQVPVAPAHQRTRPGVQMPRLIDQQAAAHRQPQRDTAMQMQSFSSAYSADRSRGSSECGSALEMDDLKEATENIRTSKAQPLPSTAAAGSVSAKDLPAQSRLRRNWKKTRRRKAHEDTESSDDESDDPDPDELSAFYAATTQAAAAQQARQSRQANDSRSSRR